MNQPSSHDVQVLLVVQLEQWSGQLTHAVLMPMVPSGQELPAS